MNRLFSIPLCLVLITLTGCNDEGLSSDEQEERDPMVKTGVTHMEQSQWAEAERAFKEALDSNPGMARPHLDLAMIYQQHLPNYIHAVYHYDRYLELRPESEKAGFIMEQRNKVVRALEIQAIQNSPEWKQVAAEVLQLRRDNAALKEQLKSSTPSSATKPDAVSQQPEPEEPAAESGTPSGHQIYTVVAGDTLTAIAEKFYGDGESWEPIYEANRDSMSSPSSLRVGQTLVIPARAN